MNLQQIFDNTDFVHASGTKEELQVAEYLKMQCEKAGVTARLEGFRVAMGEIKDAHFHDGYMLRFSSEHEGLPDYPYLQTYKLRE